MVKNYLIGPVTVDTMLTGAAMLHNNPREALFLEYSPLETLSKAIEFADRNSTDCIYLRNFDLGKAPWFDKCVANCRAPIVVIGGDEPDYDVGHLPCEHGMNAFSKQLPDDICQLNDMSVPSEDTMLLLRGINYERFYARGRYFICSSLAFGRMPRDIPRLMESERKFGPVLNKVLREAYTQRQIVNAADGKLIQLSTQNICTYASYSYALAQQLLYDESAEIASVSFPDDDGYKVFLTSMRDQGLSQKFRHFDMRKSGYDVMLKTKRTQEDIATHIRERLVQTI